MDEDTTRLQKLLAMRRKDRKQARLWRSRAQSRPDRCASILHGLFQQTPESIRQIEQSRLVLAWPDLVGESVARFAIAKGVRDRRLIVNVSDPLWRTELIFQKSQILARIRQEFPKLGISDIFFG